MTAHRVRPAALESFERQIIKNDGDIIKNWEHYLDAPGAPALNNEADRWAMAKMLETSSRVLPQMEATQTTSIFGTNYQKALLGMTRQVFPRLLGTRIAAVQPLDRPTGQIFHLTILRDDNSTLGVKPSDDQTGINSAALLISRTYADSPGENAEITKGMRLSITSTSIEIGNAKKLATEATLELVQDLQAYHNLNALDLLQGAAVDEIAQEIDALIVKAVYDAAVAHKTITFGKAPTGWDAADWRPRLQRAVLLADSTIYRASGRRPNVLVCGPLAYLELADLNTFRLAPDTAMEGGNYGLQVVGTLAGQYEVLMSRYIPDNEILVARRGEGLLDTGVVYAPYVALFVSDRFFDVTRQRTTQSFASRFGIFTVSNNVYARIVIDETATGIA